MERRTVPEIQPLKDAEILSEVAARRITLAPAGWLNEGRYKECWTANALVTGMNIFGDFVCQTESSVGNTPQAAVTRLVRKLREWESDS